MRNRILYKDFFSHKKNEALRVIAALLLILSCAAAGCTRLPAGDSGLRDEGISSMHFPDHERHISKKRRGPAAVEPVSKDGLKYVVVPWGKTRGLPQNGGYIAAVDEATGREVWLLRVYNVEYDSNMEKDKQDVFITHMRLEKNTDRLLIEDEMGRCFSVNLKSRCVSTVECR